jgi:hypothetical protein
VYTNYPRGQRKWRSEKVRESGHLSTKYPRGQIGQETDKVTEEIRNRYEIDYERDTKEI